MGLLSLQLKSQEIIPEVERLETQIAHHETMIDSLQMRIEHLKSEVLLNDLHRSGLPSEEYISHSAMVVSFDASSRQAAWVAHIISPDIAKGGFGRTNDFRDDPLVEGDAVEADYFLKELQPDSSYVYDGFGYDRGHLAPSADFSWNRTALSESYFYSNMSPQHPDFNRESWAELEATLRAYVLRNEVPLYVVTLPIIDADAERIERGVHQLPIPQRYAKVVWDDVHGRGVAFIMDNRPLDGHNSDHAMSIDRAEEITGYDFFSALASDEQESQMNISDWFPESTWDGVEPLYAPSLPPGHINTTQAKRWMGSQDKVRVCGTVVSTRFSSSGNYWLNVDKKFPNTVFNVYVRKKDFNNFDGIHKEYLLNEKVCFNGKVTSMYGLPNMNIVRQEQVSLMD
ncbi:MAG: DNA/RNA non-specific endonuclease [Flavobacteriales bacterium]|nr:DNA/RNA non-specific endonuclease [Flavobacteriales bacterium]